MMVRAVFSVLVTFGLLAGAVAWHGEMPETESRAAPELEPVMEHVREAAAAAATSLAHVKREAAPVVAKAGELALAVIEAWPPEPEPAPASEAAEAVEETRLEPVLQLPFREGPPDGSVTLATASHGHDAFRAVDPPGERDAPDARAAPPATRELADQEAWAGLIRRMLALYPRVESAR
jgi:hypothetical protein